MAKALKKDVTMLKNLSIIGVTTRKHLFQQLEIFAGEPKKYLKENFLSRSNELTTSKDETITNNDPTIPSIYDSRQSPQYSLEDGRETDSELPQEDSRFSDSRADSRGTSDPLHGGDSRATSDPLHVGDSRATFTSNMGTSHTPKARTAEKVSTLSKATLPEDLSQNPEQKGPLKKNFIRGAQYNDCYYNDSPRYLQTRFQKKEFGDSMLNHPMCICPAAPVEPPEIKKASKIVTTYRNFEWLMQKLTGHRMEKCRLAETVTLVKGKPIKYFSYKEGKLHQKLFTASAELFKIFRIWMENVNKKIPHESPQGIEICTLYFSDNAVRTLTEEEILPMMKMRKPKRVQWIDTKLVQLLPNAGVTFERPLKYITYNFESTIQRVKFGLRDNNSTDTELKVEEAIKEFNQCIVPLIIKQGIFHFSLTDTNELFLLGASNLAVHQPRATEKLPPPIKFQFLPASVFDGGTFFKELDEHEKKNRPSEFMGEVLDRLHDLYEEKISDVASAQERGYEEGLSPTRRSSSPIQASPKMKKPFFDERPPICPPEGKRDPFYLPPRPVSVGDLLDTCRFPRREKKSIFSVQGMETSVSEVDIFQTEVGVPEDPFPLPDWAHRLFPDDDEVPPAGSTEPSRPGSAKSSSRLGGSNSRPRSANRIGSMDSRPPSQQSVFNKLLSSGDAPLKPIKRFSYAKHGNLSYEEYQPPLVPTDFLSGPEADSEEAEYLYKEGCDNMQSFFKDPSSALVASSTGTIPIGDDNERFRGLSRDPLTLQCMDAHQRIFYKDPSAAALASTMSTLPPADDLESIHNSRPASRQMNRPQSRQMGRSGSQGSLRPSSQQMNRPTSQQSLRPSSQQMNRPNSQQSLRPTSQQMNRPNSQQSLRPSSQQMNRPTSQQSLRPTSQQMNRPQLQQMNRPHSNKNDQSNSQLPSSQQTRPVQSFSSMTANLQAGHAQTLKRSASAAPQVHGVKNAKAGLTGGIVLRRNYF